jgi:DNA-binding NarL/FixJ family response regulator
VETKKRVVVIEHNPDLRAIYEIVLVELGYEAILVEAKGQEDLVLDLIKHYKPDVILMDIWGTDSEDLVVLDLLRADLSTAKIPVVAMSTDPAAIEQAVASFNVRQVLLKPVDLDDLDKKITACLADVPLISLTEPTEAVSGQVFHDVAKSLAARSRALIFLWGQKTALRQPYAGRSFSLDDLTNPVARILEVLVIALQTSEYGRISKLHPEIEHKIANHARLRRDQGIPLYEIVREYQHLRSGIWCEMWATARDLGLATGDVIAVANVIDYVLDDILAITVQVYEQVLSDECVAVR